MTTDTSPRSDHPTSAPTDEGAGADDVMATTRLEAFSDGVLAIGITLLALELHFRDPAAGAETATAWSTYAAYVISFLIIGVIWMNHHLMFHYITRVDRPMLVLNTVLLMCVSFLPWAANNLAVALQTHEGAHTAAAVYGLTLAVGGMFFNLVWWHASRDHRHLGVHITPAQARAMRRQFALGPLLYLLAAVVGALVPLASLAVYVLLLVAYTFEAGTSDHRGRARRARAGAPAAPAQDR